MSASSVDGYSHCIRGFTACVSYGWTKTSYMLQGALLFMPIPGLEELGVGSKIAEAAYKSQKLGVASKLFGSKALNGGIAESGRLNTGNIVRIGWGQAERGKDKIFRIAIGAGQGIKRAATKIHFHITIFRFRL